MSDESSVSSNDSVDLTSKNFNPLKALYSDSVKLPYPKAPVLDNLTKFIATEDGVIVKSKSVKKDIKTENKPGDECKPSTSARRFEPHQEPVQARRKNFRDVLTRMEKAEGPLARLKECMDARTRIKVITRNVNSIRGYCAGYLVAFDKHWNMAMEDVTEVWSRPKKSKQPALGEADDDLLAESMIKVNIPRVLVRHETKKLQVCERHVNKILLRGEHVVSVSIQNA